MTPYDMHAVAMTPEFCVKEIAKHCYGYKGADTSRSLFQLCSTLILFIALSALMYASLEISYALTLLLAIPTAGLLTRIFIIQHDCGHGSFFNTKSSNTWTGRILSVLTFTPYDAWRRSHNIHHACSGNLDQRGLGAIDTITVAEYNAMSKRSKFAYRFYRHPLFLLLIGTPLSIIILQRLPFDQKVYFYDAFKELKMKDVWKSVMMSNAGLLAFYGTIAFFIGFGALAMVFLPVLILASWIGGWLFYVQHQFEEGLWVEGANWNMQEAALLGSSYYELPKILQWFTGNIGLHHIHHLCSAIPNYKLQECMNARSELENINRMTLRESLACLHLRLWCEDTKKMIAL